MQSNSGSSLERLGIHQSSANIAGIAGTGRNAPAFTINTNDEPARILESRTSTPEVYTQALAIAERILGKDWVAKEKSSGKSKDELIGLMRQCESVIGEYHTSGKFSPTPSSEIFAVTLLDVERASILENFDNALDKNSVLHRLKQDKGCMQACYETQIASVFLSQNASVAFIPESKVHGVKSPDLRIELAEYKVALECKRKLEYTLPEERIPKFVQDLQGEIALYLGSLEGQRHVLIVGLGQIKPSAKNMILKDVKELAGGPIDPDYLCKRNRSGEYLLACGPFTGAMLPGGPEAPDTMSMGRFPLSDSSVGVSAVTRDEDGNSVYSSPSLVSLILLDSHKIKSIVDSFGEAYQQVKEYKEGYRGWISIDVDTSKIKSGLEKQYLDLVGLLIETLFTPTQNTTVDRVIITSFVHYTETNASGLPEFKTGMLYKKVTNPHSKFPPMVKPEEG